MPVLLLPLNSNHLTIFSAIEDGLDSCGLDLRYFSIEKSIYDSIIHPQKNYFNCGQKVITGTRSKLLKKIYLIGFYLFNRGKFLKFLKKNEIKIIVVGNDGGGIIKPLLISAKLSGVKVILMQDGNYNGLENNEENTPIKKVLTRVLGLQNLMNSKVGSISDIVCVYGNNSKAILEGYYPNHRHIHITGSPKHQILKQEYKRKKRPSNWRNDRTRLLFCSSNYYNSYLIDCHNEQLKIIDFLVDLTKTDENLDLTLRLHPRENVETYIHYKKNERVHISYNRELVDDLVSCDLVVTAGSTLIIDSGVCRVKGIQVLTGTSLRKYYSPYFYMIKSLQELKETIVNNSFESIELNENAEDELIDLKSDWDSISEVAKLIKKVYHGKI